MIVRGFGRGGRPDGLYLTMPGYGPDAEACRNYNPWGDADVPDERHGSNPRWRDTRQAARFLIRRSRRLGRPGGALHECVKE